MSFRSNTARSIGNDEYVITFTQRLDCWHGETNLGPKRHLNYTKNLFLDVGFAPFEATVRARMVYYALIGELVLGIPTNRAERLAEMRLQHLILTRQD